MHIDVQESDMGGGSVLCEVDGIATIEPLKEGSEGVRTVGPKKGYVEIENFVFRARPSVG